MLPLLLALSAAVVQAGPSEDQAGPSDPGKSIALMSFNIRYGTAADGDNYWGKRVHLVLEAILGQDPDVLGLQEALHFQVGRGIPRIAAARAGKQTAWTAFFRRDARTHDHGAATARGELRRGAGGASVSSSGRARRESHSRSEPATCQAGSPAPGWG